MTPDKPMALMHVYGLHERNPHKSDTRGGGQFRAAEMLYTNGKIGGVVITGGNIYAGKPSLGLVMAEETRRRGIIPHDQIILYPHPEGEARSTVAEIELFKQAANKHGWDNLADIANETHIKEIRDELRHQFGPRAGQIPVFHTEQVLVENNPRFAPVINRARTSQNERAFQKQQAFKMKLRKFPFGRETLALVARLIPNKAGIQGRILKMLERR